MNYCGRPGPSTLAVGNGSAGLVNTLDGKPFSVIGFTFADGRITAIDIFSGRQQLTDLDLTAIVG
ncbi:hypothetical protein IU427_12095 [Nocardia beijingensis]|uniref:hypothetical protein n=1 Tax=Nocardia beijingensis TaxID=95162 RepID=UPI0018938356|nr:hypothetical protein [Nocardia beijingensis]MBF6465914.1 hypothetical protein [Nocardia beijingensis]